MSIYNDLYIGDVHAVALRENESRDYAEFGIGYILGAAAVGEPRYVRAVQMFAKFAKKLSPPTLEKSRRRRDWERSELHNRTSPRGSSASKVVAEGGSGSPTQEKAK